MNASTPFRSAGSPRPITVLSNVATIQAVQTPTEVDHYQIQPVIDVYVTPSGEDLGKLSNAISRLLDTQKYPGNIRINLRGMVTGMNDWFPSFGWPVAGRGSSVPDPGGPVPFL